MISKYFGAIVAIFLALGTVAYAQSNPLMASKTGHLTLSQETRVGDSILPPGEYEVRHRPSASGHFVEFDRWTHPANYQEGIPWNELEVAAQVPCTMKPLNETVARTALEGSKGAAATDLRIRGEKVMHVFQPGPDPSAPQNQVEYGGAGM